MLIDVRSPSIEDCGRNIESSYVLHKNDSSSFNGNPHRGGHSDYSRPSTGAAPNVNNYGLIDTLEADRHNLRHNHRRSNLKVANPNVKTGCDQFCDINNHTINNLINQEINSDNTNPPSSPQPLEKPIIYNTKPMSKISRSKRLLQ